MEIDNSFWKRMKTLMSKQDFDNFFNSYAENVKRGLVFNPQKMNVKTFLDNINVPLKQLPFDDNCFILDSDEKVGKNIFHHAGAFYMQEPSAMLPALCLPLKEGNCVLDACASPGGKTFQIAKRLNGVLVSNEIDFDRAKILQSNVERLGLNNTIVTNFDSEKLGLMYSNTFDAVLVDAPCSGEGMFRREPQAITQWSTDYVDICANRQWEILCNVDKCLKQNGYLMYSTCTYSIEENEKIIVKLVDMGYEIQDIGKIDKETAGVMIDGYHTNLAKRFYPHNSFGEGQFLCLLKKINSNNNSLQKYKRVDELKPTESKLVGEFLNNNINPNWILDHKANICKKLDSVFFCVNKDLVCDTKKVLSYGVKLGNIIKNRFEPSHNFFTAFGKSFINSVELSKDEIIQYLRGNAINVSTEINGWCSVEYCGCVVGGAKIVNGLLKNHYPKGLRLK